MRLINRILLGLCCLVPNSVVPAEHQTHLRGIVNVPGLQFALLEIHYTLGKPGDAQPTIITNSWRVGTGQQFEDATIKGGHFQFEVLELDLAQETLRTREAGEEHRYSLPAPNRPATAKGW